MMEQHEKGVMDKLDYYQCLRCYKNFGKLDWMKRDYGQWSEFISGLREQ